MEEGVKGLRKARMPLGIPKTKEEAAQYSPLVLAYMGDAAYEILIRTFVVSGGNAPVHKLHRRSAELVKAETQARLYMALEGSLSETEKAVLKRGRNAKSFTKAKNASVRDYRMATGFEALIGYLYLSGQYERMEHLIWQGLCTVGMIEKEETDEV